MQCGPRRLLQGERCISLSGIVMPRHYLEGQVVYGKQRTMRHENRAFQVMFQFAHIAVPWMPLEHGQGFRFNTADVLMEFGVDLSQQVVRQDFDIFLSFT